jgi:hypothetical protein
MRRCPNDVLPVSRLQHPCRLDKTAPHRRKQALTFFLRFLAILFSTAVCMAEGVPSISVTPKTVAAHAGQWVLLEGVISDLGQSDGGSVFLNFGSKYPDHLMSVFVAPSLARMTRHFPRVMWVTDASPDALSASPGACWLERRISP